MPREAKPFRANCRSCGAVMFMFPYTDRNGQARWMPVDPDEETSDMPDGDEYDRSMMVSHFATCPSAEEHRNRIR